MAQRCAVDDRKLKATLAAFVASRQGVVDSADAMGGAFVEVMARHAPGDTNRYVNGWLDAGRVAGVSDLPLRPLTTSRYASHYEDLLQTQLDRIDKEIAAKEKRLDEWFISRGVSVSKSKYARDLTSRIRLLKKRRPQALSELEQARRGGPYILIYGKKGRISEKSGRRVGERLATIRTSVHGGDGARIVTNDRAFIRLRNAEPHASLVEKRVRAARRTLSAARSLGFKRASAKYLQSLHEKSSLELSRGRIGGTRGVPPALRAG